MENQELQIKYIECPTCSGAGVLDDKRCNKCFGQPLMAWTGKVLLYWGKRIDKATIYQDNLKSAFKFFIDSILLFIATAGLIFGFRHFLVLQQGFIPLWQFYKYPSWSLLIFWVSLLFDGYLFYRLEQDYERFKIRIYQHPNNQSMMHHAIDWTLARDLGKNYKRNVSKTFSKEALDAITKSWKYAVKYKHSEILPLHLLISLFQYQQTRIVFGRLGIDNKKLKEKIRTNFSNIKLPPATNTIFSKDLLKVLYEGYLIAYEEHGKKVEIVDILVALIKIENPVKEIFYDVEIDLDKMSNIASWIRVRKLMYLRLQRFRKRASLKPKGNVNRAMTAVATPMLDTFSQDLTVLAKYGYLAPCVGRKDEIASIFRMVEGGPRKATVLVGNPGTGRRTIIEGIAQLMAEEQVPEAFQDKRLVSISLAKLIGGVEPSVAGKRLLITLNEVIRSGNIVLFISDIHNMIGITSGSEEGSLDLAATLASIMSRSRLTVLATTTFQDYTKYVENSALGNVFDKLEVSEPHGNEAIQILEAKTGAIENKNNVWFSYDAVEKAATLSDRYLHDRFLPEKAIELLEETAIRVHRERGKDSIIKGEDIAQIITEKTKIPLTKITESESDKLLNLEQIIHQRMVDQQEAVNMISASLRRARAGLREGKKPIANLLFLGPTGVGKTELAKTVAEVYFGSEDNMIRLDMTEYQDQSSIYRLIGDTRTKQAGFLTEEVRKRSFALVLLDEIEKAHPDLINIFLQVMDDGRLTDASGRTIDFTSTVIIATSNANSIYIQNRVKQGAGAVEIKNELMEQGELVKHFKPEFLNRLDGIIVFKPLSLEDVEAIANLQLKKVAASLELKGVFLEVTPAAVAELSKQGYDPKFGARPLKRVIQEKVTDSLTNLLLEEKLGRRDVVTYDIGGNIKIKKADT
ncbi:ATP-dependent Clp protease ATP-binding subunit [Patescibacteria group bacterium]|nr:ATP-dependent Clp protease ATP-binding subunit [Patescibacteria group bacterium]